MKPVLSRPTNAERLKAEAQGRRSAQAAFDRISGHGYRADDAVFRELASALLTNWAQVEVPEGIGEVWLASATAQLDALLTEQARKGRPPVTKADPFARLRDAASGAIRQLGLPGPAAQLSAQQWQHVVAIVEARVKTRGTELPEDWRDELAVQMGRVEP